MAEDLIQLDGNASASSPSVSDSAASAAEEEERSEAGETRPTPHSGKDNDVTTRRGKLELLGKISTVSLDSSGSESLLEELLGDIRRSRTASLASTPTFVSSEYETDCVRDVGRSEAELQGMGES